jgi:hypothetical protein
MPSQLFEVSTEEKIAALRREIEMRIRVYGRYVDEGKMSKSKAHREIEIMQAILADYEAQARWQRIPSAYRFYRKFGPRCWALRTAIKTSYTVRPTA